MDEQIPLTPQNVGDSTNSEIFDDKDAEYLSYLDRKQSIIENVK